MGSRQSSYGSENSLFRARASGQKQQPRKCVLLWNCKRRRCPTDSNNVVQWDLQKSAFFQGKYYSSIVCRANQTYYWPLLSSHRYQRTYNLVDIDRALTLPHTRNGTWNRGLSFSLYLLARSLDYPKNSCWQPPAKRHGMRLYPTKERYLGSVCVIRFTGWRRCVSSIETLHWP